MQQMNPRGAISVIAEIRNELSRALTCVSICRDLGTCKSIGFCPELVACQESIKAEGTWLLYSEAWAAFIYFEAYPYIVVEKCWGHGDAISFLTKASVQWYFKRYSFTSWIAVPGVMLKTFFPLRQFASPAFEDTVKKMIMLNCVEWTSGLSAGRGCIFPLLGWIACNYWKKKNECSEKSSDFSFALLSPLCASSFPLLTSTPFICLFWHLILPTIVLTSHQVAFCALPQLVSPSSPPSPSTTFTPQCCCPFGLVPFQSACPSLVPWIPSSLILDVSY